MTLRKLCVGFLLGVPENDLDDLSRSNIVYASITSKRWQIMKLLLLMTDRKSYVGLFVGDLENDLDDLER